MLQEKGVFRTNVCHWRFRIWSCSDAPFLRDFIRSTNKLSTKEAHKGKKCQTTKFQKIKFQGNDWIHNWMQWIWNLKRLILKSSLLTRWVRKQIHYDQIAKPRMKTGFGEVIASLHRYIKGYFTCFDLKHQRWSDCKIVRWYFITDLVPVLHCLPVTKKW